MAEQLSTFRHADAAQRAETAWRARVHGVPWKQGAEAWFADWTAAGRAVRGMGAALAANSTT